MFCRCIFKIVNCGLEEKKTKRKRKTIVAKTKKEESVFKVKPARQHPAPDNIAGKDYMGIISEVVQVMLAHGTGVSLVYCPVHFH